jgi:putative membrane protein
MKQIIMLVWTANFFLLSCNNEAKDSVEKADSSNEAKMEADPKALETDAATSEFLVKAADGGMAEVDAGKMGESKAIHAAVKRFAAMMVHDHTGANEKVKALSAARNVTLPSTPSEEHKQKAASTGEKAGKDFDRAYMDMMVDDHQKTIGLFEKASGDSKDEEVKTFINSTLPTLKMHLDSAKAIQKMVK